VRLEVIRLLAAGELNQTEIAERYGVASNTVSDFAKKYSAQILEVRGKLDDEFAGLWIAQKAARIAEYEDMIGELGKIIEASENDPAIVRAQVSSLFRAQQAALRSVAEELGSLPTRQEIKIQSAPVIYRIEGVEVENLE
jgi:predicted transcriptional regulator